MSLKKSAATAAIFTGVDKYYHGREIDMKRSAQSFASEWFEPTTERMVRPMVPAAVDRSLLSPMLSGGLYVLANKLTMYDSNSWMIQFFQQAGSSKGAEVVLPMLPSSLNH